MIISTGHSYVTARPSSWRVALRGWGGPGVGGVPTRRARLGLGLSSGMKIEAGGGGCSAEWEEALLVGPGHGQGKGVPFS